MRTRASVAGRVTRRCSVAAHDRTARRECRSAGGTSTGTDWSGRLWPAWNARLAVSTGSKASLARAELSRYSPAPTFTTTLRDRKPVR